MFGICNPSRLIRLFLIVNCTAACTSIEPPYIDEPAEPVPAQAVAEPIIPQASFRNNPQLVFSGVTGLSDQTEVLAAVLQDAGLVSKISFSDDGSLPVGLEYQIEVADSDYGNTSPIVGLATLGVSTAVTTWYQWFEFKGSLVISICGTYAQAYDASTRVESSFKPGIPGFSPDQSDQWLKDIVDLGGNDLAQKLVHQIVRDAQSLRERIRASNECSDADRG